MKQRAWIFASAIAFAGCVGEVDNVDSNVDGDVPTFEEFKAASYLEPWEGGMYIVNGDIAINVKQLEEFYNELYAPDGALIVHTSGGQDAKWNSTQKRNLTYCVSNSFGSRKAALVQAMEVATEGGWEQIADVDFVYDSSQDANCTASNNNVLFDIRPTSGAGYLARAFFPGQGRGSRNVIVDTSAFSTSWPLSGIIAHELGHVLGFRHEHTRPEAAQCFEDNNWRPLTPYDSTSVMHYPQCGGTTQSLTISSLDAQGASSLYGSPGGGGGDDGGGGGDDGGGVVTPRSGTVDGTVARGQARRYQPLTIAGGTRFEANISGSGDADLYVRFDSQPTLTRFDCRPYLNGSNELCSLDAPANATQAHIMVYGYTAASYTLTASWNEPQ